LFLVYKTILISKIGTGKIGLDPNKVSQTMINAANECLQHNQMDVLFVIHSSGRSNDPNEQSYQVISFFIDLIVENSLFQNRCFAIIWILLVNIVKQEKLKHHQED
jgi:hypothetical protein